MNTNEKKWTPPEIDARLRQAETFAATALERELLEIIRQLREPQWISVHDRFPPEKENVLVVSDQWGDGAFVAYHKYGHWIGECILSEPSGVTHWMKLPELPKEPR